MKKLTPGESKLLKAVKADKAYQLKKCQDYDGYPIPKHHPDNELTAPQAKDFAKQSQIAHSLVKKKLLTLIQDDRRVEVFAPVETPEKKTGLKRGLRGKK